MGALLNAIAQGIDPQAGIQRRQATQANHNQLALAPGQQQIQNEQVRQQQLKTQQEELAANDEKIQRQSMMDAAGDPDTYIRLLAKRGARPTTVAAAQQAVFQQKQNYLTLSKEQRAELDAQHERLRGGLEAIQAAPIDQKQAAWDQVLKQTAQTDPKEATTLPLQYPGDDWVALHHNAVGMSGSILKQANDKATGNKLQAEADKAAADALKTEAELPGVAAEATGKVATLPVTQATAEATLADKQLLPPVERVKADAEAAKAVEEKRWHGVQEAAEKGKLSIEGAKLALSQKEFNAKFGSPTSRAAFTESVKNNPDSYFSLPPEMKPGVAADLVAQGLSVPTQLPADIKSRAASAGLTLQSIDRVKALLADPDIAGAIGPIAGRLGNLEQSVGDTFFGENDPRARKEQQLRTELAYLKFQESKGLFGGRPAQQLIKSLSSVSANPSMSQNLINGSLDAMSNSMKAVGKEAKAYSFGGAQGAVNATGDAAPVSNYKVGDTVKIKGKEMKVTAVHPDGSFDAK